MMKILNLFAGIGGNRTLWGDDHEIMSIDNNADIAIIYKTRWPRDGFFTTDAYKYLEDHYKEYDFIWASPPCPTHSKLQHCQKNKRLPDMRLYSIILFLKHHFHGYWVVENVESYYKPLIIPLKLGRHYIWSSFYIEPKEFKTKYSIRYANIKQLKEEHHAEDVPIFKGYEERKMLRNCVIPEMGKHILDSINTITIDKFIKEEVIL